MQLAFVSAVVVAATACLLPAIASPANVPPPEQPPKRITIAVSAMKCLVISETFSNARAKGRGERVRGVAAPPAARSKRIWAGPAQRAGRASLRRGAQGWTDQV